MQTYKKIENYLSNVRNQSFQWGVKDCALFANDMLVEVFGMPDVGEKFRGKYTTKLGSAKIIKSLKYKDVQDIADVRLTPTTKPKDGDIALHEYSLGIVYRSQAYFLQEDTGLFKIWEGKCSKFWRYVPCS